MILLYFFGAWNSGNSLQWVNNCEIELFEHIHGLARLHEITSDAHLPSTKNNSEFCQKKLIVALVNNFHLTAKGIQKNFAYVRKLSFIVDDSCNFNWVGARVQALKWNA